jgi:hypothetical protein
MAGDCIKKKVRGVCHIHKTSAFLLFTISAKIAKLMHKGYPQGSEVDNTKRDSPTSESLKELQEKVANAK